MSILSRCPEHSGVSSFHYMISVSLCLKSEGHAKFTSTSKLHVSLVWFMMIALLGTKKFQENLEIQHKCKKNAEFLNGMQLHDLRKVVMVSN